MSNVAFPPMPRELIGGAKEFIGRIIGYRSEYEQCQETIAELKAALETQHDRIRDLEEECLDTAEELTEAYRLMKNMEDTRNTFLVALRRILNDPPNARIFAAHALESMGLYHGRPHP